MLVFPVPTVTGSVPFKSVLCFTIFSSKFSYNVIKSMLFGIQNRAVNQCSSRLFLKSVVDQILEVLSY